MKKLIFFIILGVANIMGCINKNVELNLKPEIYFEESFTKNMARLAAIIDTIDAENECKINKGSKYVLSDYIRLSKIYELKYPFFKNSKIFIVQRDSMVIGVSNKIDAPRYTYYLYSLKDKMFTQLFTRYIPLIGVVNGDTVLLSFYRGFDGFNKLYKAEILKNDPLTDSLAINTVKLYFNLVAIVNDSIQHGTLKSRRYIIENYTQIPYAKNVDPDNIPRDLFPNQDANGIIVEKEIPDSIKNIIKPIECVKNIQGYKVILYAWQGGKLYKINIDVTENGMENIVVVLVARDIGTWLM